MPKFDNLINVIDDELTDRELLDLEPPKMSRKEHTLNAQLIQDLHQERLVKYASERMISIDKATSELMRLHSEGINIASHISSVIGVSHNKYIRQLTRLKENSWFIR